MYAGEHFSVLEFSASQKDGAVLAFGIEFS